jgi:carbamoyltransferase
MNILSIMTGAHDDSGTLIYDNNVFAIEFERITRIKHNCNHKLLTQDYVSNTLGIRRLKEDDLVNQSRLCTSYLLNAAKASLPQIDIIRGINFSSKILLKSSYSHHENHAASAYFPSGFSNAAILIMDVFGSPLTSNTNWRESTSMWLGKGYKISKLEIFYSPAYQFDNSISNIYNYHNSLGVFYMDLTILCGFNVLDGGKTMGLSAYGTDNILNKIRRFISVDEKKGNITFDRQYIHFIQKEGKRRDHSFSYIADVAFAAQKILEEILLFYCKRIYEQTKCDSLCLAGGIALNSVANGLIIKNTPFKKIFIKPAASDSGMSLGHALNLYYNFEQNFNKMLYFNNFFLGKEYDISKFLLKIRGIPGLSYTVYNSFNNLYRDVASLLKKNNIIGWFQDRSEFGPRALGNRSILCNPSKRGMKDKLNKKIKFREWFRPFAPVVLEKYVNLYFDISCTSPYMLLVGNVVNSKIPEVTHVDGTARIQTVNKKQNEKLYLLLLEFYKQTGMPVLLNTSFNIKGEPIVETPYDAIYTFVNSELDYLVVQNILFSRK